MLMIKLQKNESGIAHIKLLLVVAVLVGAIGYTGWKVNDLNNRSASRQENKETEKVDGDNEKDIIYVVEASELEEDSTEKAPDGTAQKNSEAPKTDKTEPKPTDPVVAGCSGRGSKYTSEWLSSNSYSTAKKFKDAIEFAGLTSVVNSDNVVVFAPNDYAFENGLTASQKAYMQASPANMKSVIGWHIVKGCTLWDNDIENKTANVTIQTLNGPVTYKPGSPGYINDTKMAMWDWFTRNGAVHLITGFVKPPQQ